MTSPYIVPSETEAHHTGKSFCTKMLHNLKSQLWKWV